MTANEPNPIEAAFREGWAEGAGQDHYYDTEGDVREGWQRSTARRHPYGPRVPGPPVEEGVWWCEVKGREKAEIVNVRRVGRDRDTFMYVLGGAFIFPSEGTILAHYAAPVPRPT